MDKKEYTTPEIIYEADLEVKAGSCMNEDGLDEPLFLEGLN